MGRTINININRDMAASVNNIMYSCEEGEVMKKLKVLLILNKLTEVPSFSKRFIIPGARITVRKPANVVIKAIMCILPAFFVLKRCAAKQVVIAITNIAPVCSVVAAVMKVKMGR